MSERILRALMQLFAIIAKVDELPDSNEDELIESTQGKKIVESFLRSELNSSLVKQYLELFDEYLNTHHSSSKKKDGQRKRTAVNSVKVLRICAQINEELTQRQKVIVLIRIFEYIHANNILSEQEIEFVSTVAESFNISSEEYELIKAFLDGSTHEKQDHAELLYISAKDPGFAQARFIRSPELEGELRILRILSVNTFFFRYYGHEELSLNGQIVSNQRTHIFNQGSTVRTAKSQPVYYSDVIAHFLNDGHDISLNFRIEEVEYVFRNGKKGLHTINFSENAGKLIGIMGGSGTGKSTLLNVLNGNYTPTKGRITINGIDIHREKSRLEGVIGFVSQDDLLIEELTVFQNLYYNAKLCFNELSDEAIIRRVEDILQVIGLYEVHDLKVGSPLEKTISGGQRKRLNIALELIREPSVLFVDEPTSGLSSRDSENIMDLLKELALKGKLVFVVIHQPSSDIFKMFDRLFILDQGGYPIFNGDPIDAIVYFKKHVHHVNAEERECSLCGNVNPEQIFNIIESKVVDEYGNLTEYRKVSAEEWNQRYQDEISVPQVEQIDTPPQSSTRIANLWTQFSVFFKRDILSKLANRQYMMVNLLEAPVLALILAYFVKYYRAGSGEYSFYMNENIPQYIFIAVVVSLFLGLTVAAEEIIKDKKILKRESFLNLSRGSYLVSKILIMFLISAIQTLSFTLIGNWILEIREMWWEYWLILFTTSCCANLIGLNISSAFNSAKVIYIIVPLLIIPQLLFSGVIVKFDKLNPVFGTRNEVPWIGNSMITRWAYEALTVVQAKQNEFEKQFFDLHEKRSQAAWKRDYWMPEVKSALSRLQDNSLTRSEFESARTIAVNELQKEEDYWGNMSCKNCTNTLSTLNYGQAIPKATRKEIGLFLERAKKQYNKFFNDASNAIDAEIRRMGSEMYQLKRNAFQNESLYNLVTQRNEVNKILEVNGELIQKDDPIYLEPKNRRFLDAHFYAPAKYFMGKRFTTFLANTIVIWLFTIFFSITLYYDWLRKLLQFGTRFRRVWK